MYVLYLKTSLLTNLRMNKIKRNIDWKRKMVRAIEGQIGSLDTIPYVDLRYILYVFARMGTL